MSEETCKSCNGTGIFCDLSNYTRITCSECKGLGAFAKTEYAAQCGCLCHSTGIAQMKASNPPQPCCGCSPLNLTVPYMGKLESQETLKLCEHGTPVKFGCVYCLNDKFGEAEKTNEEALLSRIKELEKGNFPESSWNQNLRERIQKMEKQFIDTPSFNNINFINERIEKLETLSKSLQSQINIRRDVNVEQNDRLEKLEEQKDCHLAFDIQQLNKKIDHVSDAKDVSRVAIDNKLLVWHNSLNERIEKIENQELDKHSIRLGALEKEVFLDYEKNKQKICSHDTVTDPEYEWCCYTCLHERISALEKTPIYIVSDVMERIEKLESEIDENASPHVDLDDYREIIGRIDKLEKISEGHQKQINDVIGMLVKGDYEIENEIDSHSRRMEMLEQTLLVVMQNLNQLRTECGKDSVGK